MTSIKIAGTAALLIVCSPFVSSAKAAYIVTLEQQGSNVVASGSGTIDLTDLTFYGFSPDGPYSAGGRIDNYRSDEFGEHFRLHRAFCTI